MNKQGSPNDFMRTLLIGALLFFGVQIFLNRFNKPQNPPRTAPTLAQAFQGIDPSMGPALNAETGNAEVVKLQSNIQANDSDALAQWSRLRTALIQQYVLNTLTPAKRKSGFLGFGTLQTYYPAYNDIVQANAGDAVEAQAIYQEGDLLWRQSIQNGGKPSADAVTVLENFIQKRRGSPTFDTYQIYVPKITEPAKVPLQGVPPGGFVLTPISALHGSLAAPNPRGIVDRVNEYYAPTTLYQLFDTMVRALGAQPAYSYGLAILLFAAITRTIMQPVYKKQYESIKGMTAIQPEIKKIQEKYKGKSEQSAQMNQMKEIQELQRRHGVNPLVGCGLGLLQLPILFFVVYPMIQHYEPKMDLAGASFLWIHALSRPDIPLLILYAAFMFLSTRLSATPPTDDMQRQQQMLMTTLFPLVFPFFMASYPAAFIMYWTAYNAVTTFFQWRLMKAADPSKDFWVTLKGDGLIPKLSTATAGAGEGAVAPRPVELSKGNGTTKAKSVKIQSKAPSLNGTVDGNGVALNGGNGIHHSAPDGSVLEPSSDEVEKRKKKKK